MSWKASQRSEPQEKKDIPELCLLGKTLTSGIDSAGDVAGEVGTTEADLGTTAGVSGADFTAAGVCKGCWWAILIPVDVKVR